MLSAWEPDSGAGAGGPSTCGPALPREGGGLFGG